MAVVKRINHNNERRALLIPEGYTSALNLFETENAIKYVKDTFQNMLSQILNLQRVSAPLVVLRRSGVNDYLNGVEKPVTFTVKEMNETGEAVQSLAKWKRKALADYGFKAGEGLYTDMNALRPDEDLDNLHSIYVDQWDWERVITSEDRTVAYLKSVVRSIYQVIRSTETNTCTQFPQLSGPHLADDIYFVHSEELEERYPDLMPSEREDVICKEKGAVFIIGLGADLKNGKPHDGRASDYDDWTTISELDRPGLNGDIHVWNPLLNRAFELSSMGIRVDKSALMKQLKIRNELYKTDLDFHQRLLNDQLPLTIGGGIGQSRLCMLFLRKAHVGEVQSTIWPDAMIETCRKHGIFLL
ncbi:aspartate--ammonia ligase [bacterium]|nr:aspartate--ammonia ligase [bacterium]